MTYLTHPNTFGVGLLMRQVCYCPNFFLPDGQRRAAQMSKSDSPVHDDRTLIAAYDREFAQLHFRFSELIKSTPEKALYQQAAALTGRLPPSVAECVVRGAGVIEQSCGGITANLWDDPFEWTLPETLATATLILEYLDEVATTRQQAFLSFKCDADLLKEIMLPSGESQTLADLLTVTLEQAAKYRDQAETTLAVLTGPADSCSR